MSLASSMATSAAAAPIRGLSLQSEWRRAWPMEDIMPEREFNDVEFERYELQGGPAYHFAPDRRDFFKLAGGGIILLLALVPSEGQEGGGGPRGGMRGEPLPQNLGAWLHIGEDGAITVYTGKAECGQDIRTSLTQAVAEELHTSPTSIRLVMADTDLTPYDMGTFGSRTTPTMAPELRKAAWAAREALAGIAAAKWGVARTAVQVTDGKVFCEGHSAGFGELTRGQQMVESIGPEL